MTNEKPVESPAVVIPSKKIAIFGTTPSRMNGPIEEKDWDRWTIGPGGKDTLDWHRLFEMHKTWPIDFDGYLDDLSKEKSPRQVVTLKPMPAMIERWADYHAANPVADIPEGMEDWIRANSEDPDKLLTEVNSWRGSVNPQTASDLRAKITGDWSSNVVYPRDDMLEKYQREMWFSSSIAYLIPLAIEEGATDIGFWGIDLESGEEYLSQHIGCCHFIDLARLLGINIHMPSDCGLLRDVLPYPDRYETHLALTLEKKKKWLEQQSGEIEARHESTKVAMIRKEGEILMKREAGAPEEELAAAEQELVQLNAEVGNLAAHANTLRGEIGATDFYYRLYVVGLTDPLVAQDVCL